MTVRGAGLLRGRAGTGKTGSSYAYAPVNISNSGVTYGQADGTNDYIQVDTASWTFTIDDPWTIAITLLYGNGVGADPIFECASTTQGIKILPSGNKPQLFIYNNNGSAQYLQCTSDALMTPYDSWATWIFTYDGSRDGTGVEIYKDGTAGTITENFNNLSGSAATGTREMYLASWPWGPYGFSEVMIWDHVISSDLRSAYHNKSSISTRPIHLWPFTDGSGTTISATEGPDATLYNGGDGSSFWKTTS